MADENGRGRVLPGGYVDTGGGEAVLTLGPMSPADEAAFVAALVASGMRESRCEGTACTVVGGRRFLTREAPRTPELCPPCRGLSRDPSP